MKLLFCLLCLVLFCGCSSQYKVVRQGEINQPLFQHIIGKTSEIRGLFPKASIQAELKGKEELRHYLIQEFKEEYPPEKLAKLEKAYYTIGFFEQDVDLGKELLELYQEEVAGFYDPKLKKLFLVTEATNPGFLIGFFQMLLQKDLIGEMLVSHEYTHALQDQYFDLIQKQEQAKDDDQSLALGCLIEGDATASSLDYLFSKANSDLPFALEDDSSSLMRETLLFKYFGGLRFVRYLMKTGGYEAVNAAFRNPPCSTEQILHPEKYPKEVPKKVFLSPKRQGIATSYQKIAEDVFGEFTLRRYVELFLEPKQGKIMSAGWNGDCYGVYEQGEHRIFLWQTFWDTPKDAIEFFEGYLELLAKKFPTLKPAENFKGDYTFQSEEGYHCLYLRGSQVSIAERLTKKQLQQWNPLEEQP